jgi:hypothetical protein
MTKTEGFARSEPLWPCESCKSGWPGIGAIAATAIDRLSPFVSDEAATGSSMLSAIFSDRNHPASDLLAWMNEPRVLEPQG